MAWLECRPTGVCKSLSLQSTISKDTLHTSFNALGLMILTQPLAVEQAALQLLIVIVNTSD